MLISFIVLMILAFKRLAFLGFQLNLFKVIQVRMLLNFYACNRLQLTCFNYFQLVCCKNLLGFMQSIECLEIIAVFIAILAKDFKRVE